jgi:hypothetical protein
MTEYQHEEDFLAELLDVPEANHPAEAVPAHQPQLTRQEERALLSAANQVGTATLAPLEYEDVDRGDSFVGEVSSFVRRYPIPSLLAGVGLAYLLTRRRNS